MLDTDTPSLQAAAQAVLSVTDPEAKLAGTLELFEGWQRDEFRLDPDHPVMSPQAVGRPQRPRLVSPRDLPKRGLGTPEGRAALLHAVAHIEFNAINLALDAVQRFPRLPRAFYADWVAVAAEEATHFSMMRERLQVLGCDYGDFPAHDGLWDMAVLTADDPVARMALVPRGLEARGLDVTPGMIERLKDAGDHRSADALRVILRDEVGHVAAGSRWFAHLCEQRELEPGQTYIDLLRQFMKGRVPCPVNLDDRRRAGFDDAELSRLRQLCAQS